MSLVTFIFSSILNGRILNDHRPQTPGVHSSKNGPRVAKNWDRGSKKLDRGFEGGSQEVWGYQVMTKMMNFKSVKVCRPN